MVFCTKIRVFIYFLSSGRRNIIRSFVVLSMSSRSIRIHVLKRFLKSRHKKQILDVNPYPCRTYNTNVFISRLNIVPKRLLAPILDNTYSPESTGVCKNLSTLFLRFAIDLRCDVTSICFVDGLNFASFFVVVFSSLLVCSQCSPPRIESQPIIRTRTK